MVDEGEIPEEEATYFKNQATLEFKMDSNYDYENTGKLFQIVSNLLYFGVAYPVLVILDKMVYDLTIEGKENLKQVEKGAVLVANHVLLLDCTMIGIACKTRKPFFTTQPQSFQIPVVRKLIKLLNAIPIPKDIGNQKNFVKAVNRLLQNGKFVLFYPEAALVPYSNHIRHMKKGAFEFAHKNELPIIPMVFSFRKPKGIRKYMKKKQDVTLKILEPVWTNQEKQTVQELQELVKEKMRGGNLEGRKQEKRMKKIYIILTYTNTWLARIIRCYTKKEYSHVSISFDQNLKRMYSFGRHNPYIFFWGGFVHESPKYGTFRRFSKTTAAIYELEVTEKQYNDLQDLLLQFKKNKKMYRFNILGLATVPFKIKRNKKNYFYCAEFVKYMLEQTNIVKEPLPEFIQPEDFKEIPELHLVYEGVLKEYQILVDKEKKEKKQKKSHQT